MVRPFSSFILNTNFKLWVNFIPFWKCISKSELQSEITLQFQCKIIKLQSLNGITVNSYRPLIIRKAVFSPFIPPASTLRQNLGWRNSNNLQGYPITHQFMAEGTPILMIAFNFGTEICYLSFLTTSRMGLAHKLWGYCCLTFPAHDGKPLPLGSMVPSWVITWLIDGHLYQYLPMNNVWPNSALLSAEISSCE